MLPRWFRVVVALEIVGVVIVAVLIVHVVAGGVSAAGSVVTWARPHLLSPSPPPVSTLPAAPTAMPHPPPSVMPPGLLALLNRGTGGEYVGEWDLVRLFEAVLGSQAAGLLHSVPGSPRAP